MRNFTSIRKGEEEVKKVKKVTDISSILVANCENQDIQNMLGKEKESPIYMPNHGDKSNTNQRALSPISNNFVNILASPEKQTSLKGTH